ncbi:MAG: hypothetical protein ACE5JL_18500 [Dehalococcoidia bacterium]
MKTIAQEGFLWLFRIYFISAYVPDELTGKELLRKVENEDPRRIENDQDG